MSLSACMSMCMKLEEREYTGIMGSWVPRSGLLADRLGSPAQGPQRPSAETPLGDM